MKTIINDTNLNQAIASQGIQATHQKLIADAVKAQGEARTVVIDGSDRVPQFEQGFKGPDKLVHADPTVKRGRAGRMGKDWS